MGELQFENHIGRLNYFYPFFSGKIHVNGYFSVRDKQFEQCLNKAVT